MPKALSTSSIGQAPLVRRLSELGLATTRPSRRVFADRLAEQIDIASAITLSDFFKTLGRVTSSVAARSAPARESLPTEEASQPPIDELFRRHREHMRQGIDACFSASDASSHGLPKSLRLPQVDPESLTSGSAKAAYQRFYALQQSELERRTVGLKAILLEQLRTQDTASAQVAALETALEPIIAGFSRRALATMPQLVGRRFEALKSEAVSAATSDLETDDARPDTAWLTRFHTELQRLLHAEMTLRLQPLEGLASCVSTEPLSLDTP